VYFSGGHALGGLDLLLEALEQVGLEAIESGLAQSQHGCVS
jgi:hypothetical protein